MAYKLKTQRIAEEKKKIEFEQRLQTLCIDFGQFLLDKLHKNGILAEKIEVAAEDVRDFTRNTTD